MKFDNVSRAAKMCNRILVALGFRCEDPELETLRIALERRGIVTVEQINAILAGRAK